MSKFNSKSQPKTTTSYEGGKVFERDAIEEWLNFLFSSYLENQYYENAEKQQKRFIELTDQMIEEYGADFVANAACFARDELGLRSISQLAAAILNKYQFQYKRLFFSNFCQRPDDMGEIFAAIDSLNNKRSHAVVRGFADYLQTLKPYTLAKYKMLGKDYNIYDIINICHPKPTKAIQDLKDDKLKPADTWETRISAAGTDQEKKHQEWIDLVENKKLGYMALLRNLRNILEAAPCFKWVENNLCPQIINKESIKRSRIYPYQIYSAYKALDLAPDTLKAALEKAFMIACENLDALPGKTAVILDVSGSMDSSISDHSDITLKEVGAVFAVMYYIAGNDIDFIKFGNDAKRCILKSTYSPFQLVKKFTNNDQCGYGTCVHSAFELMNQSYNRILLISDMQIMDPNDYYSWSSSSGVDVYNQYCKQYGPTHIYSFDLSNYHTQIANPNNPYVHLCTALNDKVFEFMKFIENDEKLVDYINQHYDFRLPTCRRNTSPILKLAV